MPRILIVDDEPEMVRGLEDNLRYEGYQTVAAPDGRRGLALALSEAPDLILLDVMMPQVDGWEMLQRVHERHGVGAIPVIMFSGKVDEEALKRAAAQGAQGFVGKPFSPQQLIDSTKQLIPA